MTVKSAGDEADIYRKCRGYDIIKTPTAFTKSDTPTGVHSWL